MEGFIVVMMVILVLLAVAFIVSMAVLATGEQSKKYEFEIQKNTRYYFCMVWGPGTIGGTRDIIQSKIVYNREDAEAWLEQQAEWLGIESPIINRTLSK